MFAAYAHKRCHPHILENVDTHAYAHSTHTHKRARWHMHTRTSNILVHASTHLPARACRNAYMLMQTRLCRHACRYTHMPKIAQACAHTNARTCICTRTCTDKLTCVGSMTPWDPILTVRFFEPPGSHPRCSVDITGPIDHGKRLGAHVHMFLCPKTCVVVRVYLNVCVRACACAREPATRYVHRY